MQEFNSRRETRRSFGRCPPLSRPASWGLWRGLQLNRRGGHLSAFSVSQCQQTLSRYLPSPRLRSLALKQESGDAPAAGKPRGEEGGAWRGRGRSSVVMATTAVLPDPRRCCKAEDAPVPQRSRIGPPAQPESRWGPRCPRRREGARRAACSQTCRRAPRATLRGAAAGPPSRPSCSD